MQIHILDLIQGVRDFIDLDFDETLEKIELKNNVIDFNRPAHFKGTLRIAGKVLKLTGNLNISFAGNCYKCDEPVHIEMDIEINESFVNAKYQMDTEEEVYVYHENLLDTGDVFRDNIILNLPMRYECSGDCKGLCPSCGANLNYGKCSCKNEYINPMMEKLKTLLDENT